MAVARWSKTEHPAVVHCAERVGTTIYWGDEMGLRSDHVTGTSDGLVGRTLVISVTGELPRTEP